ncbi:hypothetical protein L3X38_020135 [Prunus dulcis]|uniref:Uncharacterized protein n=1 Tax=Prunus dulcis TaxID=3755 RepID=A0AAD4WET6_PRUDU|nr:hypothetical protein L3X38_020135 [Prunus dulcis]
MWSPLHNIQSRHSGITRGMKQFVVAIHKGPASRCNISGKLQFFYFGSQACLRLSSPYHQIPPLFGLPSVPDLCGCASLGFLGFRNYAGKGLCKLRISALPRVMKLSVHNPFLRLRLRWTK